MTHAPSPLAIDFTQSVDPFTKHLIMTGVLLGLFLSALDQTIVGTALPRIITELHGLEIYTWVTSAYLITNTALVPVYGKLSDLYGRRPVLIFGIVLFLLASALCGIAGEPWFGQLFGGGMMQLVLFRGLQGAGGAALTSIAFAVVGDLFVPLERPRYQALNGAIFGLSSVLGPLLVGILTDQWSWRWVFYVNLPLGLIALAFVLFRMPTLSRGIKGRIDWWGSVLLMTFSVAFMLALRCGAGPPIAWGTLRVIGCLTLSIGALVAFLLIERRQPDPVLPLKLFARPTFTWTILSRFLFGSVFISGFTFLSLYLVQVAGVSATRAGVTMIPLSLGIALASIFSGQLARRLKQFKPVLLGGLLLSVIALGWLSTLQMDTPYLEVILRMILLGAGLGPCLPTYTMALQLSAESRDIGAATASGQFFQQLGSTIGVALFGVILTLGTVTSSQAPSSGLVAPRATMSNSQKHIQTTNQRTERPARSPLVRIAERQQFATSIATIYRISSVLALVALLAAFRLNAVSLEEKAPRTT